MKYVLVFPNGFQEEWLFYSGIRNRIFYDNSKNPCVLDYIEKIEGKRYAYMKYLGDTK